MKTMQCVAAASLVLGIVGCASAPRVAVQEPVGPCHRTTAQATAPGSLQVYTARVLAGLDINAQAFLWNEDFGRNEFLYEPAHTDYAIYGPEGKLVEQVRNTGMRDVAVPTLVRLPAGLYTVEAEAEMEGTRTMTVVIPVLIEAGQATTVHLEPNWARAGTFQELGNVVQLSDGRVIGCRAQQLFGLANR